MNLNYKEFTSIVCIPEILKYIETKDLLILIRYLKVVVIGLVL